VSDPTGYSPLHFWLAYLHPAWMIFSLVLVLLTLRAGLRLRRARLLGRERGAELFRRHLRVAKPAVVCVMFGAAGGLLSIWWLRGRTPFATAHAAVAALALLAYGLTAFLGRRLELRRGRAVFAHALVGTLAVLLSAAALVTGFVLLP